MIGKPRSNGDDRVGAALQALLASNPEAEPSLFAKVASHIEIIDKLRERGHSYAKIAGALREAGVDIAENTLRIYVGRLRREATTRREESPNKQTSAKPNRRATGAGPIAAGEVAAAPVAIEQVKGKGRDLPSWATAEPDEENI